MNSLCGELRGLRLGGSPLAGLRASARPGGGASPRPCPVAPSAALTSTERRVRRHLILRKKARGAPRRAARPPHYCRGGAGATLGRAGLSPLTRRGRRPAAHPPPQLSGSEERPRLAVFRSNQHIYAQVIDDTKGVTLVGLGSVSGAVQAALESDKRSATKTKDAATVVGRLIAEKCKEKGIDSVVFDRGGRARRPAAAPLRPPCCAGPDAASPQVQVPRPHRGAGGGGARGGSHLLEWFPLGSVCSCVVFWVRRCVDYVHGRQRGLHAYSRGGAAERQRRAKAWRGDDGVEALAMLAAPRRAAETATVVRAARRTDGAAVCADWSS